MGGVRQPKPARTRAVKAELRRRDASRGTEKGENGENGESIRERRIDSPFSILSPFSPPRGARIYRKRTPAEQEDANGLSIVTTMTPVAEAPTRTRRPSGRSEALIGPTIGSRTSIVPTFW